MTDESDADLLRLARGGNAPAWTALARRHVPLVRRFFETKAPAEHVDDLVQETFARLIASAQSEIEYFRGFLVGIARNVLREFIRERMRDPRVDFDALSAADLDPRPSTLAVRNAERRLLIEAMRRLSLAHQTVLELYYWEDISTPEISVVLGEVENTIRGRLNRARVALREKLAELETMGIPNRETDAGLEDCVRRGKPPGERADDEA